MKGLDKTRHILVATKMVKKEAKNNSGSKWGKCFMTLEDIRK